VKIGLQIDAFTWPGGPAEIGPTLGRIARTAEDAGFDSIWVMDHFFQIRGVGPATDPMLEGWTTLGFLAGLTTRARLGLMVGGIHYRTAGLWAKTATTLDVLSGGRAWLGIGAAWNEEESRGLGFPMPPLGIRFEMLEEMLQITHALWTGERGTEGAFAGRHYQASRLLNSPQNLTRPHPPIMIGGGGEQKTLRLVAQYADATNVFGDGPRVAHKFAVLREHCERIGRDYDEIERTNLVDIRVRTPGSSGGSGSSGGTAPGRIVDQLGELADAGVQHVIMSLADVEELTPLEVIGHDVISQVRDL
jgi:F420-dependent oxidoreductase-like protein